MLSGDLDEDEQRSGRHRVARKWTKKATLKAIETEIQETRRTSFVIESAEKTVRGGPAVAAERARYSSELCWIRRWRLSATCCESFQA